MNKIIRGRGRTEMAKKLSLSNLNPSVIPRIYLNQLIASKCGQNKNTYKMPFFVFKC